MTTCVAESIDVITSAVKPGGVSTIDPVVVRAQDRVDLAQELGADGARLVGPPRRDQRPHAGGMRCQERVELVGVERARRLGEVVDGSLGREPEAERDVPELQVEVDERDLLASLREADGEVGRGQRLAGAALGPEDADEPRVLGDQRRLVSLLSREQLVHLEAHLLGSRREHHDVVCAGLERAPEEAVR